MPSNCVQTNHYSEFFTPALADSLEWLKVSSSFQDSPQDDLNNASVWMVSTRTLISKSSSPCISSLVTVPRAPITIGITIPFMFHSLFVCFFLFFFCFFFCFFSSLTRSRYLTYFSLSFNFTLWCDWTAKFTIQQIVFIIFFFFYSFRVFHISGGWRFFTGVWVTASLLKTSGLVSRFWPFPVMLSFG